MGGSRTSVFLSCLLLFLVVACSERVQVVIVGAGMAGMAAADFLFQNNISFVVLEASDRIGGRIQTLEIDGMLLDTGAHYVFGRNYLHDVGESGQMIRNKSQRYQVTRNFADQTSLKGVLRRERRIMSQDLVRSFEGSYACFMMPRLMKKLRKMGESEDDLEAWKDLLKRMMSNKYWADSLDTLGARGASRYQMVDDSEIYYFDKGFQNIVETMIDETIVGGHKDSIRERVMFDKLVTKIQYNNKGVTVTCKDGTVQEGDRVIVTLPLGVLKELPEDFFKPPLPHRKKIAIESLGVSNMNKIFLQFDKNWWTLNKDYFYFGLSTEEKENIIPKFKSGNWPLDIVSFEVVDRQAPTVMATIMGEGSKQMEDLPPEKVLEGTFILMKEVFKGLRISKPKSIIRTTWSTNPYYRGSHSYPSLESDAAGITPNELAAPIILNRIDPIVMFAGEATDPNNFGTAMGALDSGRREAERVLSHNLLGSIVSNAFSMSGLDLSQAGSTNFSGIDFSGVNLSNVGLNLSGMDFSNLTSGVDLGKLGDMEMGNLDSLDLSSLGLGNIQITDEVEEKK